MSIFDQLLQQVVNRVAGSQTGDSGQLASGVMQLLGSSGSASGGLAGLVQGFQQKGLGDIVSSWISTGKNLPISAQQIQDGLGSGLLQQFAGAAGLSPEAASSKLAEILPGVVDGLTPDGKLPESGGLLEKGLGFLKGQL